MHNTSYSNVHSNLSLTSLGGLKCFRALNYTRIKISRPNDPSKTITHTSKLIFMEKGGKLQSRSKPYRFVNGQKKFR